MPQLIVVAGLSGSGKSHFADALARLAPITIRASADVYRRADDRLPAHLRPPDHEAWYRAVEQARSHLRAGRDVIIDGVLHTRSGRDSMRDLAEGEGAEMVLIWIQVTDATARRNLERRLRGEDPADNSRAGWPARLRQRAELEHPTSDERPLVVDEQSFDRSLADVLRRLSSGQALEGLE